MTKKNDERNRFAIQHGFRPDTRPGVRRYEAALTSPEGSVLWIDVYHDNTKREKNWFVRKMNANLVSNLHYEFSKADGGEKSAWKQAIGLVNDLMKSGYTLQEV